MKQVAEQLLTDYNLYIFSSVILLSVVLYVFRYAMHHWYKDGGYEYASFGDLWSTTWGIGRLFDKKRYAWGGWKDVVNQGFFPFGFYMDHGGGYALVSTIPAVLVALFVQLLLRGTSSQVLALLALHAGAVLCSVGLFLRWSAGYLRRRGYHIQPVVGGCDQLMLLGACMALSAAAEVPISMVHFGIAGGVPLVGLIAANIRISRAGYSSPGGYAGEPVERSKKQVLKKRLSRRLVRGTIGIHTVVFIFPFWGLLAASQQVVVASGLGLAYVVLLILPRLRA